MNYLYKIFNEYKKLRHLLEKKYINIKLNLFSIT